MYLSIVLLEIIKCYNRLHTIIMNTVTVNLHLVIQMSQKYLQTSEFYVTDFKMKSEGGVGH